MNSKAFGKVLVGHPVDVATGKLFHEFEDYTLPGRMPLIFARRYSSALSAQQIGMFGPGWFSPFEMRICRDIDGYRMIAEDGETEVELDDPTGIVESGRTVRNFGAFHELREDNGNLIVSRWNPDSEDIIHYIFPKGKEGQWWHLAKRLDVEGQGIEIERDAESRMITLKQRREKRGYRLIYNKYGRVTEVYVTAPVIEVIDGLEQIREKERLILRYKYHENGLLAEMIDAAGQKSSYEYDTAGRMIREVTLIGMVYEFQYDSSGRCIRTSGANDFGLTRLEFFETERKTLVTNSFGHNTVYEWNANGQVERETSPLGHTKATAFDNLGRVVQETTPEGANTSYVYDERGDRVNVTSPTDAVIQYGYNEKHQVITITDPIGGIWRRTYDAHGRLAEEVNPLGNKLTYVYDGQGDLLAIQDLAGHSQRFVWDPSGNLRKFTDPLTHHTHYDYDEEGRIVAFVDALGHHIEARLDVLGRLQEVRLPDGATRRFSWDSYDSPTQYIDELGAVTSWGYTTYGHLDKVIWPNGGCLRFQWSTIPGQLIGVVNERSERWQFTYDADGRLLREKDFAGRESHYTYNKDGYIVSVEDAAGQTTAIIRNPIGAATEVKHDDRSTSKFEYDLLGRLIKSDNGYCPVEWTYDAVGRIVCEKQGTVEIRSEYDALGDRVRRVSSLAHETTFGWDANGKVTQIRSSEEMEPVRFEYDARQDETARYVGKGTWIGQAFDSRGRRVSQQVIRNQYQFGNQVGRDSIIRRQYTYNAASNLTRLADSRWGDTAYTYDLLGRVLSSFLPGRLAERFQYDITDNLKELTVNGDKVEDCRYAQGNILIQRGSSIYSYDELGQLISKREEKGETRYAWDRNNQLSRVTLPDGSEWRYEYDAYGRRIRKLKREGESERVVVEFIWDGDVVLHEIWRTPDETPRIIDWEFEPDSFAPISKTEGKKRYLCVNDIAGNPRELVTDDGQIVWDAQYTVWGEIQSRESKIDCPVRFQGQWHDEETGLYYNRFRYYDPEVGRYISPDPIDLTGGTNVYTYASNTIEWVDPYGLKKGKACEVVLPSRPHKNGTRGHWSTILAKVQELKESGLYKKIYVNKGLAHEIKGAKPNRRPDIMAVRKRTNKIDQFEVPSKTDVPDLLKERMKENQKIIGNRAGTIKVVPIK